MLFDGVFIFIASMHHSVARFIFSVDRMGPVRYFFRLDTVAFSVIERIPKIPLSRLSSVRRAKPSFIASRGIDVGAKYEIYRLIIELAEKGKGIILVSSEMPELIGVCDRIIVMSGGRVSGEVSGKELSQEKIMDLATRFA